MSTIAQRVTAQLLSGAPARDPLAVAERLLAIQAQDPRGARLAIRSRTERLGASDVDRALAERSLLITWLNRGTLHLVRSEDYTWLHALTTPPLFAPSARRLAQEGLTPDATERAMSLIERSLADEGPLTRAELQNRLSRAGVRTEGQALYHLLFQASLRGILVRGPLRGSDHAFALTRDWLPDRGRPVEREQALGELARRYLEGHAPASDRDLAKWSGLPLRDVRVGLAAIGHELVEAPDGVRLARQRYEGAVPGPRLLGSFDPLLHGWVSREPILASHSGIVTSNGIFRPFALVNGRAVATWRLRDGTVGLEPFEEIKQADAAALEVEAADVIRFLQS